MKKKSLNIKMWHLQGAKIIRNNQRRFPNDVTEEKKNNTTQPEYPQWLGKWKTEKTNAHFNQHLEYLLSLNSSNEFDFLQQFTFSLYNLCTLGRRVHFYSLFNVYWFLVFISIQITDKLMELEKYPYEFHLKIITNKSSKKMKN